MFQSRFAVHLRVPSHLKIDWYRSAFSEIWSHNAHIERIDLM
jgi:hypothetical protein